jgi:AraC-like DNA-binding protein
MAFSNDRYSDQMARRIRSLQRGSFDSLLRGGVYSEDEARAILPYLEVRYDPTGYCIAVVRVHRVVRDVPHWSEDDTHPGDDAERVLRVHIGKRGYVYRRRADEIVVFWSDSITADADQLRRRIVAASTELESRSGATLEHGIGEWQTSLVDAGRSLREAERRLEVGALDAPDSSDGENQTIPFPATDLCTREPGRSVQHYVLRHYRELDLALGSIARHLDFTETYLSQIFREQTGVTYSLFLERIRVEAARRLLQASSLSISEIAARVGYQTNSTFFRAFRRMHKQGPSAYRNAARIESPLLSVVNG